MSWRDRSNLQHFKTHWHAPAANLAVASVSEEHVESHLQLCGPRISGLTPLLGYRVVDWQVLAVRGMVVAEINQSRDTDSMQRYRFNPMLQIQSRYRFNPRRHRREVSIHGYRFNPEPEIHIQSRDTDAIQRYRRGVIDVQIHTGYRSNPVIQIQSELQPRLDKRAHSVQIQSRDTDYSR